MKELEDTLHSFWRLESLGICEPDKSLCEDFDSMIEFKEGRHEVSLPWKESLCTTTNLLRIECETTTRSTASTSTEPDISTRV